MLELVVFCCVTQVVGDSVRFHDKEGMIIRIAQPGEIAHTEAMLKISNPAAGQYPVYYVRLNKPIAPKPVKDHEVELALMNDAHARRLKKWLYKAELEMRYYEHLATRPKSEIGWQLADVEARYLREQYKRRYELILSDLMAARQPIWVIPVSALDAHPVRLPFTP